MPFIQCRSKIIIYTAFENGLFYLSLINDWFRDLLWDAGLPSVIPINSPTAHKMNMKGNHTFKRILVEVW